MPPGFDLTNLSVTSFVTKNIEKKLTFLEILFQTCQTEIQFIVQVMSNDWKDSGFESRPIDTANWITHNDTRLWFLRLLLYHV